MYSSIRHRCLALVLTLLVGQTAVAAHMATHLSKSLQVDCQICLCQASETHALPALLATFAGPQPPQFEHSTLPDSNPSGVTFRAFLQRAPPAVS